MKIAFLREGNFYFIEGIPTSVFAILAGGIDYKHTLPHLCLF
jgi:hypothetical protein